MELSLAALHTFTVVSSQQVMAHSLTWGTTALQPTENMHHDGARGTRKTGVPLRPAAMLDCQFYAWNSEFGYDVGWRCLELHIASLHLTPS